MPKGIRLEVAIARQDLRTAVHQTQERCVEFIVAEKVAGSDAVRRDARCHKGRLLRAADGDEFAAPLPLRLDVINRAGGKATGKVIGLQEIVVRDVAGTAKLEKVIALYPTKVLSEIPLVSVKNTRTGDWVDRVTGISEKLCGAVAGSRAFTGDFQRLLCSGLERRGVFAAPAPPVAQK